MRRWSHFTTPQAAPSWGSYTLAMAWCPWFLPALRYTSLDSGRKYLHCSCLYRSQLPDSPLLLLLLPNLNSMVHAHTARCILRIQIQNPKSTPPPRLSPLVSGKWSCRAPHPCEPQTSPSIQSVTYTRRPCRGLLLDSTALPASRPAPQCRNPPEPSLFCCFLLPTTAAATRWRPWAPITLPTHLSHTK